MASTGILPPPPFLATPGTPDEIVPEEDATSVISILVVRTDKSTGVYVDVTSVTATTRVHIMNFLVDTGSAVSIMGEHQFQGLFANPVQLTSSHLTLLDFSPRKIPVLGSFHAIVTYKGKEAIVTFHVMPCGTSLLGLDAVQALGLRIMGEELRCLQMSTQECRELPAMSSGLPQSPRHEKPLGPPKFGVPPTLWTKFGHLFLPGLGLVRGLGADRPDEPEVVHQPEEQPVPLRRSTRERRPPERLGDYVQ
ncbi:hypothetical protein MRX96_022186 [Rhipicephalus microplus]